MLTPLKLEVFMFPGSPKYTPPHNDTKSQHHDKDHWSHDFDYAERHNGIFPIQRRYRKPLHAKNMKWLRCATAHLLTTAHFERFHSLAVPVWLMFQGELESDSRPPAASRWRTAGSCQRRRPPSRGADRCQPPSGRPVHARRREGHAVLRHAPAPCPGQPPDGAERGGAGSEDRCPCGGSVHPAL